MPIYIFKCPACKQLVSKRLPRKRKKLADECNALLGRRKVQLTYVRTKARA